ncbi:glycosyltransferase family 2 protein [Tessaracoccus rhinocerotis]|uniref:glycosyltransferase family 2 protein n=1 Tax=Tessaracoccus rhinocerotis TaxID=1689449 RepID=UPI00163DD9DF|nr:glycosyltransferase family 2 protein [Tessaracoccus rhinocerotis]
MIVVTYNNEGDVDALISSLRSEAMQCSMRVILVDNGSVDATVARASAHADVHVVDTGCNLGYAGGINRGSTFVGETETLLILNPDTTVVPGAVAAMRRRRELVGADLVVPALEGSDGRRARSLRREPSISRRLGDAVCGRFWNSRPSWLSEDVRDRAAYAHAHPVEWATGAALMVSAEAANQIGPWDERFFLYSEETDYFRRARELGFSAWYEPSARVIHAEGGSGRSPALVALLVVNSLRYVEKHRPVAAPIHRALLILHELRRWRDPDHRLARTILWRRKSWEQLPQGEKTK